MDENMVVQGSGGGGCFRAGSLVQLENGRTIPIEKLNIGDSILSYNEKGIIEVAKVTKVHYHENPEPLLRVKFWNGETYITPNHWVQNQYGSFVEVASLTIEDAFVDGMGHLRPIISMEPVEPEPVWNLTVEPNHTFIIDGIRVHNGGYRERFPVAGSGGGGGGKGGGGRAPIEDPDSLRSYQLARVVDVLSEGPIEGFATANPLESIYLDGVPIAAGGQNNFKDVTVATRLGYPYNHTDQTHVAGFSAVEVESVVSVEVTKSISVIRTFTNTDVDRVRVTLGFPRLTYQDPNTGDLHGTSVKLLLEKRAFGGGWVSADCGYSPRTLVVADSTTYTGTGLASGTYAINNINSLTHDRATFTLLWEGDANYTEAATTSGWANANVYNSYKGITGILFGTSGTKVTVVPYSYATIYYRVRGSNASWNVLKTGIRVETKFSTVDQSYDSFNEIYSYQTNIPTQTVALDEIPLPGPGNYEYKVLGDTGTCVGTFKFTKASAKVTSGEVTITGKSNSRYQCCFNVLLAKEGYPWDIRVTRLTDDAITSNYSNKSYWDTYTEIVDAKLAYPNVAYVASTIDSRQFDAIPVRGYLLKGLKVQVPTNYNPITRTYTGIWDGTFKIAWTDNPAWCYYDILTNKRYGLGTYLSQAALDLTKWELYTIGRYCDAVDSNGNYVGVPTGLHDGSVEPRFSCNLYIQTREEAYSVLNSLASIFRGISFWANGTVFPVQDSPKNPVALFNPSNVIDGSFMYEGTSLKARHNVALVTWNDPDNNYKQAVEYVEDRLGIEKYNGNINEVEILAVGCTSRGQAHRVGRWALYSERLEDETVTFSTGLEGLVLRPGDIIQTMDPTRAGIRIAGRILNTSSSKTSLTLDSSITIETGKVYEVSYVTSDGKVRKAQVLNSPGTYSSLTVSDNGLYPIDGSTWILTNTNYPAESWRILTVKEGDSATTANITALAYNPDKFANIEDFSSKPIEEFAYAARDIIPSPVSNLKVTDGIYLNSGTVCTRLYISWSPSTIAKTYRVRYKNSTKNGNWSPYTTVHTTDIEIDNVSDADEYIIQVIAVSSVGLNSLKQEISYVVQGKKVPPIPVTGLIASPFKGALKLSWTMNPEVDIAGYEIRSTNTDWGTAIGYLYRGKELSTLVNLPMPSFTSTFYIKAYDTSGNYSTTAVSTSYTGGVILPPSGFTYSIDSGASAYTITLKWDYIEPEAGLKYYEINDGSNTYYSTGNTYNLAINWTGSRSFTIRTVDINTRASAISSPLVINIVAPSAVSAPVLKLIKTSGQIQLGMTWSPNTNTTLPISKYEIRSTDANWGSTVTSNLVYTGESNAALFPNAISIMGPTSYYYIRAYDSNGNYSAASTSILLGLPAAPATVAGFNAPTISGNKLKFSWTENSELDIVRYEVRLNDNTGWGTTATSSIIYSSINNSFEYTPPVTPDALNFYIKAVDVTDVYSATASSQLFTYSQVPAIGTANIVQSLDNTTSTTNATLKLSWPDQSPQFGLGYYKVTFNSQTVLTNSNYFTFPADWGVNTARVFSVVVVDKNGKESAASTKSVTLTGPTFVGVPSVTYEKIVGDLNLNVTWPEATPGTLPISYYEVRWSTDNAWGTNTGYLYKGTSNSFSLQKALSSSHLGKTLVVRAYDIGKYSSNDISLLLLQPGAPSNPTTFTSEVLGDKVKLSWNDSTSWDTLSYEIRTADSSWGNVNTAQVFSGFTNSCIIPAPVPTLTTAENTTYYLKAWDAIGTQATTASSTVFTYNTITPVATATTTVSYSTSITGTSATINWVAPTTQFPVKHYELELGTGGTIVYINSTSYTLDATWGTNPMVLGITAVDINGKKSTKSTVSLTLTKPSLSTASPTVTLTKTSNLIAANLTWLTATKGSLPIGGYELRTTTTGWGASDSYLKYRGDSTSITLADGSSYLNQTWYLKVFDTLGNYSTTYQTILIGDIAPPASINFVQPAISPKLDTNTLIGINTTTGNIILEWQPSTSLDITGYDIRTQNPADWLLSTSGRVFFGSSTSTELEMMPNLTLPVTYNYYVKAKDVSNTYSTAVGSVSFTYTSIPSVTGMAYTVYDDTYVSATIKVYWTEVSPQFGLQFYKIYDGTNYYYTKNNYIEMPANWLTSATQTVSRTFTVYTIDNNDNSSSASTLVVALSNPNAVGTISTQVLNNVVKVSWPSNTVPVGGLPIVGYEVRSSDAGWGTTGFLFKGSTSEFVAPYTDFVSGTTSVSKVYYVKAYDTDKNYSYGTATSITITPQAVPTPTLPTYSFFDDSSTSAIVTIKWQGAVPEFGLKYYKIEYVGGEADPVYTGSQYVTFPANWVGDRTFKIYAIDNRGVSSTALTQLITKYAPNAVSQNNFTAQVIDNTVMLTWTPPATTTLPISHYLVKSGEVVNGVSPTWANAENDLGRKDGAFTTITEVRAGTYKYFIRVVDTDNVESVETSRVCEVAEPPDFIFKGLKNLEYATTNSSTVVTTTNVYTSTSLGLIAPVDTSETWSGHYTAVRVSAGTIVSGGTGYTVGSVVELNTGTANNAYKARFEVTAVNAGVVTGIKLLKPGSYSVAPSASGATVLISGVGSGLTITPTTGTWANPQAQITAGYPIYISPAYLDSTYEETIDFGVVLASSKVTLRYSTEYDTAYPMAAITTSLAISPDNTTWTTYVGVDTIFATNFRYVKVIYNVTAKEGSSIIRIYGASVLLDAKLRNDADTVICNDQNTDPVGTIANFNKEFVDITSIVVSPSTTVPAVPVYDFKDAMLTGTYSVASQTATVNISNHGQIHGQNAKLYVSSGVGTTDVYQVTGYSIASATSSGTTAIINTNVAHGLVAGSVVTITGATPTGYNGTYTLTTASASTMTLTTTGSNIGAMTTLGYVTPRDKFLVYMPVVNTSGNISMYSQGMRIYLFNQAGTRISGLVSWSAKGY